MKTKRLLIILVLSTAPLLFGCSPKQVPTPAVPAGAQAGDLIGLEQCDFQPAKSKTTYAAECGTLAVAENWDTANSRLIGLPVVRIPARDPHPAEPVFYLEGGPGESNRGWAPPDWLVKNHDVVMVGYRGVEGRVILSCPELSGPVSTHKGNDLFSEQARTAYVSATKQCAARLQSEGRDLSGYTIPGVIEDMEAARIAMGYHRINLFSRSNGTRVAQLYADLHPNSLHRLVLIGVNTPGHFIWNRAAFDTMLEHISDLCAKDTACSSRTRNLAQTMYGVNHSMPQHWLIFAIDPGTVRMVTQLMFFSNPHMPMIFDAYLAAGEGDLSGLAMISLLGSNPALGLDLRRSPQQGRDDRPGSISWDR